MEIDFDPAKNEVNISKHGLALEMASEFDFDTALVFEDKRLDYGEDRFIAYGLLQARVHVIVYTIRDQRRRVISLRKANLREVTYYEQRQTN